MRLLLLDGAESGGAAHYAEDLARALGARHEVTLLRASPSRPPGLVESDRDGFRTVTLGGPLPGGYEAYRDRGVVEAVRPLLERFRPEVAHVNGLWGLSARLVPELRARGAPVVVMLHDFWPLCPLGQLLNRRLEVCPGPAPSRCRECVGEQVLTMRPAARSAGLRLPMLAPLARLAARASPGSGRRLAERDAELRELLRAADAVVAPSRFLCERMAGLGVPGVTCVPIGIAPGAPEEPAPDPAGRVRFGFLGSAIPSKGVHVLAAAFRALDAAQAELRIHGGFPPYHGDTGYRAQLEGLLGPSAGDALRGPFTREQLPAVLAEIDVVVVPSLWEENAPLVVLEAQRARRPLIVSGHGALPERVRCDVDGLHVPPGDPDALAAAMRRLLDPELRGRLGASPLPIPTAADHAAQMEDVYARARRRFAERPGSVGVVVVDRGRPEDAAGAARSALDPSLEARTVIVENGPCSEPLPEGPWELVALPVNRGYAAGVNAGLGVLQSRGCDRFLILNNDARLEPGALRRLAEVLEDPGIGAVAPVVLREADGKLESRGMRLDLRWGRHRLLGHGEDRPAGEALVPVEAVSGAALVASRAALDAAGGFDEELFHGFEDAEWCLRLRRRGLAVAVHHGVAARHRGGSTLGPSSPEPLRYAARNHVRVVEKLAPRSGAGRWLRRLAIAGLHVAHALRQSRVRRAAALGAVVAGTRSGWRGAAPPEQA